MWNYSGSTRNRALVHNPSWSRLKLGYQEAAMDAVEELTRNMLPFGILLGIRVISAAPERVIAEMKVREDMCTRPAVLHGGALMALADTLGGCATSLNLRDGAATTTIESKTNSLAPAPVGTTVSAECVAIHRGRRTMVWQTRVTSERGKPLAIVTQTQAVLPPESQMPPDDGEGALANLFSGKPAAEQIRLLARLERAAAQIYRALVEGAGDPRVREELAHAAERELANADAMQRISASDRGSQRNR
jgi:1,4-dihydroxy-2-naphthoyl-CoA hydrolase